MSGTAPSSLDRCELSTRGWPVWKFLVCFTGSRITGRQCDILTCTDSAITGSSLSQASVAERPVALPPEIGGERHAAHPIYQWSIFLYQWNVFQSRLRAFVLARRACESRGGIRGRTGQAPADRYQRPHGDNGCEAGPPGCEGR